MQKSLALLAVALLSLLPSCATIMAGKPEPIALSSEPPGATVRIDGAPVGVTPMQLIMPSSASKRSVRLELDGYHPHPVYVARDGNAWVIGNALFGILGLVGIIVDVSSGATSSWSGDPIHAQLIPTTDDAGLVVEAAAGKVMRARAKKASASKRNPGQPSVNRRIP